MLTLTHSMLDFIASRDHRLMRRVNNWRAPRWIRLWMIWASRGGDGWLWYTMLLVILVFGGENRWAAIASCGTAAGLGTIIFLFLKRTTGRTRPCAIAEHCWAKLLPPDRFSFPSGHSITAFSMAVPLGLFYPSLRVGVLFCAFSIALSRILLGLHFLSDVLVGCLLGSMIGYSCYLLFV